MRPLSRPTKNKSAPITVAAVPPNPLCPVSLTLQGTPACSTTAATRCSYLPAVSLACSKPFPLCSKTAGDSRLLNYRNYETLRYLLSNLRWWIEEYR